MNKRVITFGEVMMRLTAQQNERFIQSENYKIHFGGTEANVAVALANWDFETCHITALPEHDIGKKACKYLKANNVNTEHIQFKEGRIGLYFMENGSMQRSSKIIYDRFESVFSKLKPSDINWKKIFKGGDWFHWTGITPALSANAAQLCLEAIQEANRQGLTISGDINYRRNLWQYGKSPLEIMPKLIKYTDIIIAGMTDFKNCLNIQRKDFAATCKAVQRKYSGIETFATTYREAISSSHNKLKAVLWNDNTLYKSKEYEMNGIVDRIGGGDAFMAGLIYGLLCKEIPEALEFAVASSVFKHSIVGDANLTTVKEIEQLVKGDNVGRLLR